MFHFLTLVDDFASFAASCRHEFPPDRYFYIVDSFFLARCVETLRYETVEKLIFCSGPVLGPVRFLTAIHEPALEQSALHVRPTPGQLASVLRLIEPYATRINAVFHSHPGQDVPAPSSADQTFHRILEKIGYRAIGAVCNNAGYIRFFSHSLPFEVFVLGQSVEPQDSEKKTFRVRPISGGRYENC